MARLAGVDLPREKRMEIALTYIYGIGKAPPRRPSPRPAWTPTSGQGPRRRGLLKLRDYIEEHFRVEGDLRREVPPTSAARWRSAATRACATAAACLSTGSAPSTNARTRKGPRKTIAGKKKAGKK